jgi:hypothetical protein
MTGDVAVVFNLMVKLVGEIVCECNIVSGGLGFGRKIGVCDVNQNWEIGEIGSDFGVVNGYQFPVLPAVVPPRCICACRTYIEGSSKGGNQKEPNECLYIESPEH